MDAQVTVARELLEQIVFERIKPDDDAALLRVVWDTREVSFVFAHPTMSGPQGVTVYQVDGATRLEYRALL